MFRPPASPFNVKGRTPAQLKEEDDIFDALMTLTPVEDIRNEVTNVFNAPQFRKLTQSASDESIAQSIDDETFLVRRKLVSRWLNALHHAVQIADGDDVKLDDLLHPTIEDVKKANELADVLHKSDGTLFSNITADPASFATFEKLFADKVREQLQVGGQMNLTFAIELVSGCDGIFAERRKGEVP